MFFNRLTAFTVCILLCAEAKTQVARPDVKFGGVTADDFTPTTYSLDSSAAAICLYEEGKTRLEGSSFDGYFMVTTVFKRIRLLSKDGSI